METWWTTYTGTSTRSCSTTLRRTRRTLVAASLEGAPLSARGKGECYLLLCGSGLCLEDEVEVKCITTYEWEQKRQAVNYKNEAIRTLSICLCFFPLS